MMDSDAALGAAVSENPVDSEENEEKVEILTSPM